MAKKKKIRLIDMSLEETLQELQKQMNEALGGGISNIQAQKELAFRIKQLGLHNFRMKNFRMKKSKKEEADERFPFRL